MLAELERVVSSYHGAIADRFQHEDTESRLICVHTLIRFVRPVKMYGVNSLYEALQRISMMTKYSTQLSIAPVDLCNLSAPNNTLAHAILAGFVENPSAVRDSLWREWNTPLRTPLPMSFLPSPPDVVVVQHVTRPSTPFKPMSSLAAPFVPVMYLAAPPKSDIAWAGVNPDHSFAPLPGPSISRAATPGPSIPRAATPRPFLPPRDIVFQPASDQLLALLQKALFSDADFCPGTEDADAKFQDMLLAPPQWLYTAEDAQLFTISVDGPKLVRNTLKNSMLRCLKMLSEPMIQVGEAVYDASLSMVEALRDGKDTFSDITRMFVRAHDNTMGILPVIKALSSVEMESEHEVFEIGMKRPLDTAQIAGKNHRKALSSLFAAMSDDDKIRKIYVDLLLANEKLYAMEPDEGFHWNWAQIVCHVEELKDILSAGCRHCSELLLAV